MATGLGEYRGYITAMSIVFLFFFLVAITPPQLINGSGGNAGGSGFFGSFNGGYFDPAAVANLAVSFNFTLGDFPSQSAANFKLQTGTAFGTPEGLLFNLFSSGPSHFNFINISETKIFTIFTYSGDTYDFYCNGRAYIGDPSAMTSQALDYEYKQGQNATQISCSIKDPSGGRTISVFFAWNFQKYAKPSDAWKSCTTQIDNGNGILACPQGKGLEVLFGLTWDQVAQTSNWWDFVMRLFSLNLPSVDPLFNWVFILVIVLPVSWIILKLISSILNPLGGGA